MKEYVKVNPKQIIIGDKIYTSDTNSEEYIIFNGINYDDSNVPIYLKLPTIDDLASIGKYCESVTINNISSNDSYIKVEFKSYSRNYIIIYNYDKYELRVAEEDNKISDKIVCVLKCFSFNQIISVLETHNVVKLRQDKGYRD